MITPEQVQNLDEVLRETTGYKELKESESKIFEDLERLNNKVDDGFEKGEAKMDKHSEKIRALDVKVDKMASDLKGEIKELGIDIIRKLNDKEMGELKAEVRKKNEEESEAQARKWDLTKIFLASIVGAVITYIVVLLGGGQ